MAHEAERAGRKDAAFDGVRANRKAATLDEIRAHDGARAYRTAEVGAINVQARTVELAFSSEAEVERWYGFEVLSHDPGAAVLTRLQNRAALLLDHDWEKQIGVVQTVSMDADRRGRAVVRFGKSAKAEEIFQDVIDGIRCHVSVGYRVLDARVTGMRDEMDVWTVTRWEPFEISIVSVPADISVGVGRQMEAEATTSAGASRKDAAARAASGEAEPQGAAEAVNEGGCHEAGAEVANGAAGEPEADSAARNSGQAGANNESTNGKQEMNLKTEHVAGGAGAEGTMRAAEDERARVRAIMDMGEQYGANDLAREAVREGVAVGDFQRKLLDHVTTRNQKPLSEQLSRADVGLTEKEVRNFSFLRMMRALALPGDRQAQEDAAFELEASSAAASKRGQRSGRHAIPTDVLRRALNTSTSGAAAGDTGGYGVANTLLASSFIDILRNRATIMQLGTVMGGLVGTMDIPKQVSAAQGYWIGEGEDAPEQTPALGQVSLSPKTVAAYSDITRRLLMQSSLDAEAIVRADLAKALALSIDKAGYYGTGVDKQPRGITATTGINAVTLAAEQPTFAELVEMETQISLDNADVSSMAYVANAAFRGYAKTALKFDGVSGTIWEPGNTINGYRTEITNQVNKGDVVMGNFADLLVAMWGGLDLTVDPYSNSKSGTVRLVVFQDVDFAIRRTESFCLGRKAAA